MNNYIVDVENNPTWSQMEKEVGKFMECVDMVADGNTSKEIYQYAQNHPDFAQFLTTLNRTSTVKQNVNNLQKNEKKMAQTKALVEDWIQDDGIFMKRLEEICKNTMKP